MIDEKDLLRLALYGAGEALTVAPPQHNVFRIKRSSVPCNNAIRSSAFRWVVIRPNSRTIWVGCRHVRRPANPRKKLRLYRGE
jgi:hypothetical protein